jgi:SHS2 domain-containing protein
MKIGEHGDMDADIHSQAAGETLEETIRKANEVILALEARVKELEAALRALTEVVGGDFYAVRLARAALEGK